MTSTATLEEQDYEFNAAVQKIRERDRIFFRLGIFCLVAMLIATGFTLYRWMTAVNQQLAAYENAIAQSKGDLEKLHSAIAEQTKVVESTRSFVSNLNQVPIKVLIESSSNHRREIDVLRKQMNCIVNNSDKTICKQ